MARLHIRFNRPENALSPRQSVETNSAPPPMKHGEQLDG